MSDRERAAELADEVHANGPRVIDDTPKVDLVCAALHAYAPAPGDVREAVYCAIANTYEVRSNGDDDALLYNIQECTDAVLFALQAEGWGPRAEAASSERQRCAKICRDAWASWMETADKAGEMDGPNADRWARDASERAETALRLAQDIERLDRKETAE